MSASLGSWQARFEGKILHIVGVAKYPDRSSTAGLERLNEEEEDVISYRVVFHRDKEPFCDLDLVGAVHHFEQDVPGRAKQVRVSSAEGTKIFPIER